VAAQHLTQLTKIPDSVRLLDTRPLKQQLNEWVAGLDYGLARRAREAGRRTAAARWQWSKSEWMFSFAAYVMPEQKPAPRFSLVRAWGGGAWADDKARIRKALDRKATKYGDLDAPLVIAVLCNTTPGTVEISNIEDVLYGALVGTRPADAQPPKPSQILESGLWLTRNGHWRRPGIPQVIVAMNEPKLRIPVCQPTLWTTVETDVASPEQPAWLAGVRMTPRGSRIGEADSTAELLGLPDSWPNPPTV
jgi:hypothetical protein